MYKYMGNKNTKTENLYMDKIKDYNIDVDETNEITIDKTKEF